jgi:23S rRNA pseudouridine1911/1915/1917 synthase
MAQGPFCLTVSSASAGLRLDLYLTRKFPEHSRAFMAQLIRAGQVSVNGNTAKAGCRLRAADTVSGTLPAPKPVNLAAEAIDLAVIHEDADLIVVNKPAGLVVHPAPGHAGGTLVNALLYHCPDLGPIAGEIRPGIVHRLDKDTSGVLVVAKTAFALDHLARQFKERKVGKTYLALVHGIVKDAAGRIELPIGRHPVDRKKMSVRSRRSRPAVTLWRVRERYIDSCLLEVDLKTGRTHQIRVHCAALGHPVLGDRVYGNGRDPASGAWRFPVERQMLHAWRLKIVHPFRGEIMNFEAPLAPDMDILIQALRREAGIGVQAAFSSGLS